MSTIEQLPPEIQERLARLQQLQNTLQSLVIQKQRIEMEQKETERALASLEEVSSETKVYKSIGSILVEKQKEKIVQELKERKDFLDMRLKVVSRQEGKTRERLTSLQQRLQKELSLTPAGP